MPVDNAGTIEDQLKGLKKQRQVIKSKFTRLFNGCNDPQSTLEDKMVRARSADQLFSEFETIQQTIEELIPDTEILREETHRAEVENKYLAIKSVALSSEREVGMQDNGNSPASQSTEVSGTIQQLIENQSTMSQLIQSMVNINVTGAQTPQNNRDEQQRPQSSRHELRLPAIQIPEFDGQILNWLRFRDLFESMIHARESISNAKKLEYLHTKLKGDALSLIRHIKSTNENYVMAWELLKNKYDKSEKIKHVYLSLLLEQQAIKSESVAELRRLYNGVNEAYNALRVLEEPVSQWNSILIYLLEKKLDNKTSALWYREKKQDEITTVQQCLSFIDKRVFELESTQRSVQFTSGLDIEKTSRRSQAHVFAITSRACVGCDKNHGLYQCEKFREMNVDDRRSLVKLKHLCFNCLQPDYSYKSCKSSSCKRCGGKYNTMLHLQSHQFTQEKPNPTTVVNTNTTQQQRTYVLLPTAIVMVKDKGGYKNVEHC